MMPVMSREEMEERRFAAVALFQEGKTQAEVCRTFSVSRMTASRWERKLKGGGLDGMKLRKPSGRRSRLREADLQKLRMILDAGDEGKRWTGVRFAQMLKEQFEIKYHRDSVFRIMHLLGWKKEGH